MAVVIPLRRPARARLAVAVGLRQTGPPELADSVNWHLPLAAADREALLAALEMALAVCGGDGGAARRIALAYPPAELGARLDALADRVFALGRQRPMSGWQMVIGPRS